MRILCIDVMDTVLSDPYRQAIEAATGQPLSQLSGQRDPRAWPDFELGRIDEHELARRFWTSGATFDLATFHRVRRAGYRWLPGMPALLDDLGGRVGRHAASNYPVWMDELAARFAFHRRFEGVWASHALGARKPQTAFFERLLERIGVPARECLFVDDRPGNCAAAQWAGMAAHVFVGADDLRARLAAEGVLAG